MLKERFKSPLKQEAETIIDEHNLLSFLGSYGWPEIG
jgi:hypothetical protein